MEKNNYEPLKFKLVLLNESDVLTESNENGFNLEGDKSFWE